MIVASGKVGVAVLWGSLAGFGLAVLPVCLTPGTSFTLVTQRVLHHGARSGPLVIAGTACGLLCHAVMAGLGLSALVMRSSEIFTAVKIAGAVYLAALGCRILWRARTARHAERVDDAASGGRTLPWNGHGDYVQGFLGNVLNPKAAAVYLTIAPQFVSSRVPVLPQMIALSCVHMIVVTGWLSSWTAVVHLSRRTIASPSFRRAIDRVTGAVLIALGVRAGTAAR